MTKRKRASLKDKSPETLGLTQKKGKGMDLLFGGSVDKKQADTAGGEETTEDEGSELNSVPDNAVPPPGNIPSGTRSINQGPVDELGLPIALEAPPDDLILASTPAETAAELDNLATSPFAMPVADSPQTTAPVGEPPDLNGIMEDDNASIVEEEKVSSTEENNNANTLSQDDLSGLVVEDSGLSGLVVETSSATTSTADLSGLAMGDLSGLAATSEPSVGTLPEAGVSSEISEGVRSGVTPDVEAPVAPQTPPEQPVAGMAPDIQAPAAPEGDLAGLAADVPASFPNDFTSPASPQTTAAPIYTTPSYQGGFDPATGAYATNPAAAPAYTSPAPTAPPPPRPVPIQIDQAPAAVVNALSAFGQTATPDKFTPKDELPPDDELVVKEVTLAERDDDITRYVMEYIGPERRDKLFNEIETLYGLVSDKLSGNKKDVNFALDTLRHAHNLILENPREYDEAFYRVAIVKTILNRKTQLSSWSYSWGLFVLLYGIIWLAVCMIGGYYIVTNVSALLEDRSQSLSFQALFSAFCGGIGGSVAVLWVLYYRVSVKQDFDRQYLMFYLVKPILGFVLGLVMYFLLIAASSIGASGGLELGFETATGISLAAFMGFVAGFRQDNVYDWIYVIIKTISPKAAEESQSKSSLVPPDIVNEDEVKQVKVSVS